MSDFEKEQEKGVSATNKHWDSSPTLEWREELWSNTEVPVTSLTSSNMETRMDRPKSVVRVIRGVG